MHLYCEISITPIGIYTLSYTQLCNCTSKTKKDRCTKHYWKPQTHFSTSSGLQSVQSAATVHRQPNWTYDCY